MSNERLPGKRRSTSGTFRGSASEVGTYPAAVAIDELGAIVVAQAKAELTSLTQIALKGRLKCVILKRFRSSLMLIFGPKCGGASQPLSTKFSLGSAPAELVRMVFPTYSGLLCSSVWRLCLCRWTARKRTRRYQVPSLENWKNYLNGA